MTKTGEEFYPRMATNGHEGKQEKGTRAEAQRRRGRKEVLDRIYRIDRIRERRCGRRGKREVYS
jgi:hypothetical protein